MSNPEFKRNLWLSFSTHRLVAMPALLALTFLAAVLADPQDNVAERLYLAAIMLFIFIVWLWGARNANAAIVDELRDKTWDQQRMSALDPWTMTWGKLFGSTSFNWYGGAMCLAVIAAAGFAADIPDVLANMISLCATGVMLHAALIALNLHANQFDSRLIQRGGMGWLLVILVFIPVFSFNYQKPVHWWGMEIGHALFWLNTSLLFAACATFAAWRVVCNALQVRTLPWAWPALACILAVFASGFAREVQGGNLLLVYGVIISSTMTYVGLLSEPNTLLRWRKLRLLQERGDWRGWLEHLPLWPTTLALAFVCVLLLMLLPLSEYRSIDGFSALMSPQLAFIIAMMTLRDACILLFFSFAPNGKRAVGATMLYLLVLNMLLPFLAQVAGLESLRHFFIPFNADYKSWNSVPVIAVHVAIALWLVRWRLRNAQVL